MTDAGEPAMVPVRRLAASPRQPVETAPHRYRGQVAVEQRIHNVDAIDRRRCAGSGLRTGESAVRPTSGIGRMSGRMSGRMNG